MNRTPDPELIALAAQGLLGPQQSFREFASGYAAPKPQPRAKWLPPLGSRPVEGTPLSRLGAFGASAGLMAAGATPGVGEAIDAADLGRAVAQRDLLGGSMAAAGLALPFVAAGSLKRVAEPVAEAVQAAPARAPIRAFHGSPHDFDRFDMSKIGTGEGNQSYGHGLYFSENPIVANSYRGSVSAQHGVRRPTIGGRRINWDDPTEAAAYEAFRFGGDRAKAADFHEKTFNFPEVSRLLRSDTPLPEVTPPGHGYEVAIHAGPDEFLDWDAPLQSQPKPVQDAVARILGDVQPVKLRDGSYSVTRVGPDGSGNVVWGISEPTAEAAQEAYRRSLLQDAGREAYQEIAGGLDITPGSRLPEASSALRGAGVKGVRYLDQGSRDLGEGTRNYVLFDDSLVEIMRKYGLAGAMGAGMAGQMGADR